MGRHSHRRVRPRPVRRKSLNSTAGLSCTFARRPPGLSACSAWSRPPSGPRAARARRPPAQGHVRSCAVQPASRAAPREPERLGLTARDFEVLRLAAAGRSNREIAAELFTSAKTASVHVPSILGKLGLATCGEAAATACRHRPGYREDARSASRCLSPILGIEPSYVTEEAAMNPHSAISYELSPARIADRRRQAQREELARAAAHPQSRAPRRTGNGSRSVSPSGRATAGGHASSPPRNRSGHRARRPTMSHLSISAVRAGPPFASALQPSAEPPVVQVRQGYRRGHRPVRRPRLPGPRRAALRRPPGHRRHPDALGTHSGHRRLRRFTAATGACQAGSPTPGARHLPCRVSPGRHHAEPGKDRYPAAPWHTPVMPAIPMMPESPATGRCPNRRFHVPARVADAGPEPRQATAGGGIPRSSRSARSRRHPPFQDLQLPTRAAFSCSCSSDTASLNASS